MGRKVRRRTLRRERLQEFEKMTAIMRRYVGEDLLVMKGTLNELPWHKRLWQAVKLAAGRF